MSRPVLVILSLVSISLLASCKKLEQNTSFSSTLLDRFSADNKLTTFSLTPYNETTGQAGHSGPYISYTFSDGLNFIETLDLESLDSDQNDLFNNYVSNLLNDDLGDFWILTYSSLDFYDGDTESWTSWTLPTGRRGFPITVAPQRDGSLICINEFFILHFQNGQFTDFSSEGFTPFNSYSTGTITSTGEIWITGSEGVIRISEDGDCQIFKSVNAEKEKQVITISFANPGKVVEDSDGNIWVPTRNSLVRFNSSNWTLFDKDRIPELDGPIQTMATDETGNLWLVSGMNLIRLFPDGYSDAVTIEGLKDEEYGQIAGLHVKSTGEVWLIGTFGIIYLQLDLSF